MKKVFSLLLVTTTILSFCACSNTNSRTNNSENVDNVTKGETWEKSSLYDLLDRSAFATSKDEFKEKIVSLINVEEYECSESDSGKMVTYSRIDRSKATTKSENAINFYDGSVISLPADRATVEKAGWTLEKDGGKNSYDTYVNKNNDKISLLEDSVILHPVAIDESGTYIETECPDFKWNGITQNSTIEEILQIGAPIYIEYSEYESGEGDGGTCRMCFDTTGDVSATISYTTGFNFMKTLTLQVES